MSDEVSNVRGFAPGLVIVVLGPPTVALVAALWGVGLRPVRGHRINGTLWAMPESEEVP